MVSSSTTGKPQILSYAERAKRASSAVLPPTILTVTATPNLNGNLHSASTNKASLTSSKNLASNSTVRLTRPSSPPPADSLTANSDAQFPAMATQSRNSSKPTTAQPNVWTMRKEQMAQRAVGTDTHSNPPSPKERMSTSANHIQSDSLGSLQSTSSGLSPNNPFAHNQPPSNGLASARPQDDSQPATVKAHDDSSIARPPSNRASNALAPTLPSLDDAESWPKMGIGMNNATSANVSVVETDKKDSSNGQKKGECSLHNFRFQ